MLVFTLYSTNLGLFGFLGEGDGRHVEVAEYGEGVEVGCGERRRRQLDVSTGQKKFRKWGENSSLTAGFASQFNDEIY